MELQLDLLKSQQVALGSWAFLFGEIINYNLKRVDGISELESKLNWLGYRVGQRQLELYKYRLEGSTKNPKQQSSLIEVLQFIHSHIWKSLFGKAADSLEKSKENANEYMISDNAPILSRSINIPKDLKNLSTESFTSGIVESVLDATSPTHNNPYQASMITILGLGSIGSLISCKLHFNKCAFNVISRVGWNGLIKYKHFGGFERSVSDIDVLKPDSAQQIQQLIVATKASDALPALESVRHKLNKDASVLFLQNGLGYLNHARLKTYSQQLLISNTNIAATFKDGTLLEMSNGGTFNVTPYIPTNSLSRNSNHLLNTLSQLDNIQVNMVDNKKFLDTAHLKLVANCAINALATLHNCTNGEVYKLEGEMVEGVIQECSRVLGLDESTTRDYVMRVFQSTKENYNSTHRDIYQRGKRAAQTEVDYINGHILREANLRGINTPHNQRLYDEFMCKFQ